MDDETSDECGCGEGRGYGDTETRGVRVGVNCSYLISLMFLCFEIF